MTLLELQGLPADDVHADDDEDNPDPSNLSVSLCGSNVSLTICMI